MINKKLFLLTVELILLILIIFISVQLFLRFIKKTHL